MIFSRPLTDMHALLNGDRRILGTDSKESATTLWCVTKGQIWGCPTHGRPFKATS